MSGLGFDEAGIKKRIKGLRKKRLTNEEIADKLRVLMFTTCLTESGHKLLDDSIRVLSETVGLGNVRLNCWLIAFIQFTFKIQPFVSFMIGATIEFGTHKESVYDLNIELFDLFKSGQFKDDMFVFVVNQKLMQISDELKLQSLVIMQLVHMYNVLDGKEPRCKHGKDVDYLRFLLWAYDRDGFGRFGPNSQWDPDELITCFNDIAPGCGESFFVEISHQLTCRHCGEQNTSSDTAYVIDSNVLDATEGVSSHLGTYEGKKNTIQPGTTCDDIQCKANRKNGSKKQKRVETNHKNGSKKQKRGDKLSKEYISGDAQYTIVRAKTVGWNRENNCSEKVITQLPYALRIYTPEKFKTLTVHQQACTNKSLKAMIVHLGDGPNSGHYVTYTQEGADVYRLDDKRVTRHNDIKLDEFVRNNLTNVAQFLALYE